jgi:general secretion pathway protein A
MFSDTGWEALVLASGTGGGIPRVINSLCDRSLNAAFEREKTIVDIDDVSEVAEGMGIDKEIFHYKIALRSKKKNNQSPDNGGNASVKESVALNKEPAHSPDKGSEKPDIKLKRSQPESPKSILTRFNTAVSAPETDQKSLKTPMLFLSLSIAALVLSIFFYCSRSASPDLLSCLLELIGL